jgi:hypothetical protein
MNPEHIRAKAKKALLKENCFSKEIADGGQSRSVEGAPLVHR